MQVRGFRSDSKCAKAGESSSSNPLISTLTLSPHPNANPALESLNLSPLESLPYFLTHSLTYACVHHMIILLPNFYHFKQPLLLSIFNVTPIRPKPYPNLKP